MSREASGGPSINTAIATSDKTGMITIDARRCSSHRRFISLSGRRLRGERLQIPPRRELVEIGHVHLHHPLIVAFRGREIVLDRLEDEPLRVGRPVIGAAGLVPSAGT